MHSSMATTGVAAVGPGPHYDQRNSLVVGIAMGFAVIPIIFTIAEDSLPMFPSTAGGVPGLGQNRWQTACVSSCRRPARIFSAIMIGCRAGVGETMIV